VNLFQLAKRLTARWRRWQIGQYSSEDRNILYFSIDTACQGLVHGGIATFISIFVVRLGASSLLVSLLTSLPAMVGALLSIPMGLFVERQQDPIRVTNRARLFHRGSFLLIALLPFFMRQGLAEATVVLWALNSVPAALINLSWMAVVAEIIPPKRRPSVNGARWALLGLVTAVAVALCGYMLDRLPFPISYQIVFAISFLGGVLSIYFFSLIQLPPAQSPRVTLGKRVTLGQRVHRYVRSLVGAPLFVRYLLTTSVLRFALNLPAALYSIYWIRHLNASDLWIGWQSTAGSLALIVGYFLWGRVASRKGHHLVLLACTFGVGIYPVMMGFVPTEFWLPLVAVVRGFFITGIDLSFFDTLLQVCPPDKRASFIALNTVVANLAIFLAPMAGSLLSGWLSIRVVFLVSGGIHLLATLLFGLFHVAAEEEG
jgi:MFS family permease